jgi:hypothetical protein
MACQNDRFCNHSFILVKKQLLISMNILNILAQKFQLSTVIKTWYWHRGRKTNGTE